MRVHYNEEVEVPIDDNNGRYQAGKGSVFLLMSHQKDLDVTEVTKPILGHKTSGIRSILRKQITKGNLNEIVQTFVFRLCLIYTSKIIIF